MDARFLRACRRQPVDSTPVWFMRQAGRYLPEYRALRERHSLLDICRTPELALEATLQPLRALDVDAAILFSDLLLPLGPLGVAFRFAEGEGPVVDRPLRTAGDVERLRRFDPRDDLRPVLEAVRLLTAVLGGRLPLIGFAGAPFTLASYAVEGGRTAGFARIKGLMYAQPAVWHRLAALLAEVLAEHLLAQVEAGVQAVQVFDSWVGALDEADYRELVLPHTRALFDRLRRASVPVIHFATGAAHLLDAMREAGGDVLGLDWRTPLDEGWRRWGEDRAVQGNLDPVLLLGPRERLLARVDDVLRRAGGRPGHVFNLGHGVLPETPVENVRAVVERVHEATKR